ncbi:MAG: hypothetical protein GXP36_09960 [Actinobacteria bacterium]|nr:hypothetical protein [Actinomycetota bacterium]
MSRHRIVEAALAARTTEEAAKVQDLIEVAIGARYQRPIGDRWNNQGLLTASGSNYNHKALEVVTNMQDAILELHALQEYGRHENVPFKTPYEAATVLLARLDRKERAALATVTIDQSSTEANRRHITLLMRDHGCGIRPNQVPRTIFQIGTSHKDGVDWQQGTFGLGGATTYRNSDAVVLVTRRHPDLLQPGDEDRITVAVVQWERVRTTTNAFYLVASPWEQPGDEAAPISVLAAEYPDFQPGTHLALIAYATEGLGRRSGDERSFDTVFNTRLYRPVVPISYRNNIVRAERVETLDGLERRFDDNPGDPGTEGLDTLPFTHAGGTYHLPMRFRLFAKPGQKGQRRNFVAHGHALVITSNGQVHSHWQPQEFKFRTKLNKLYDRILVVVESDALPIEVRTELFTADRAQLVRNAAAIRLEHEIAAFLDDWAALQDANSALIKEAITGDNNDRPTIEVARKIARALKVKGFSAGGTGTGGSRPKPPDPVPPEDLYDNPTHFEGPDEVVAPVGKAKGIYFKLNAKDGFLGPDERGNLHVTCDHPDIGLDEITVGDLRSGRVRVSIAVPETEDLGPYQLHAVILPWPKSSGGLGPQFEWTTKLELVSETKPKPGGKGSGKDKGSKAVGQGNLVALIWRSDEDKDDWNPSSVGDIEMVTGKDLAAQRDEYEDLAKITDEIPTIVLNRTHSPLKKYVQARAVELTDDGKEQARERYAVGVGVALLILNQQRDKDVKNKKIPDEETFAAAARASARAVLSVLPDYDRLAKELED